MLTIMDLLMLSRMEMVLPISIITNAAKSSHSLFEKALKTELIWSFVGNLAVIVLTGASEIVFRDTS